MVAAGYYPSDYQGEEEMMERYIQFWHAQAEWSQATFGPDNERGPIGPLKHLAKEAAEAQEEYGRYTASVLDSLRPNLIGKAGERLLTELADLLFLVFDATRRAGFAPEQFIEAAFAKLEVNKKREWKAPEWVFDKPQFIEAGGGCMANEPEYWRQWARLGDRMVCGTGATQAEAEQNCKQKTNQEAVEHTRS